MLNKDNQRELAYIVKIDKVEKHPNADRLDICTVNGWRVITGRDEFQPGDLAIYFEIDSKLPETEPWTSMEFLASKHFKIKTQKLRGELSQGFLVSPTVLGWKYTSKVKFEKYNITLPMDSPGYYDEKTHMMYTEGDFLTKALGVTYSVAEDNVRKGNGSDKYKAMAQRNVKLTKTSWWRWLYKRTWGKKLLFLFFGKKRGSNNKFPKHFPYIHISDEERCENLPWILEDKEPWIKTLKVDGTSSTYILERKPLGRFEFYVCSRTVRQLNPQQANYHNAAAGVEGNVYWDMNYKYHIQEFLQDMLDKHKEWSYVCLQGETAGLKLQGNPHKFPDVRFFGFNFIDSENGRWNSVEAAELCNEYGIPWVPIIDDNYILPDDFEEFKLSADGPCEAEGASGLREGYVYRSLDGVRSFKNVSREYLLQQK